tara:strand:- start:1096 stop:1398 length:303 start_codon:yes stop_codon:yes gene_type:complete
MSKFIIILSILTLVIVTTITKNTTKKIESKIFQKKENIRILTQTYEYLLLDYNYLSSPERLMEYQNKFFEEDLEPISIKNINKIILNDDEIILINKKINE